MSFLDMQLLSPKLRTLYLLCTVWRKVWNMSTGSSDGNFSVVLGFTKACASLLPVESIASSISTDVSPWASGRVLSPACKPDLVGAHYLPEMSNKSFNTQKHGF